MLPSVFKKVFGTKNERELKRMQPLVARIGDLEASVLGLDDAQLAAKTVEFKSRIDKGEPLDDLLPEAYAVCREAGKRVLGMRHYDVQMVGGIVLHRGSIAEMRTGEGKTLTATLSMYLNALAGKGAHLVTVNDYLASRDAEWMGQLYNFLGMSVGTIVNGLNDTERQQSYAADITYGTNNEFGFDYLRDNMKFDLSRLVQRPLAYAIVDEVDSILIDEARTPLIISGQAEESSEMYRRLNEIIAFLVRDEDYIVDEEHRSASLTDEGIEKIQEQLEIENLFEPTNIDLFRHSQKSLQAHALYHRDEQYLVRDGEVIIIDEFTGRAMEGRRWSDGLHQAVEAKEGVPIKKESVTLATITYQNFFRMYDKLSGMTGTAATEEEEFGKIYELGVYVIPTNKPIIRDDMSDLVYRTEREKFTAIVDQILECHERGQPVLVGTISVDKSEVISKVLRKRGIPHEVLNAKNHGGEAGTVAQAGRKGSVTIATNMAGRGTDIILGGNPDELAKKGITDFESEQYKTKLAHFQKVCAEEREHVLSNGGLFILGTERHDSRRIDNQLRGRAGRQGDPGQSRFFLSLEDDLMRRFGADRIQGLMARLGMEDGVPIEANMVSKSIEGAQRRVEGRNFDIRKNLLEYDEVLDAQRNATYELRRKILLGEDIETITLDAYEDAFEATLENYASGAVRTDDWDMEGLSQAIRSTFNLEVSKDELPLNRRALEEGLWKKIEGAHNSKIAEMEIIAERYNERYAESADFEAKTGKEVFIDLARTTYLRELDRRYQDHLGAMRHLRDSVGLQAHAQKDPKQIYKKEGYELFSQMKSDISSNVTRYLMRVVVKTEESVDESAHLERQQVPGAGAASRPRRIGMTRRTSGGGAAATPAKQPNAPLPKLGRNEPCWCGSGKKYKHCHLRHDQDSARPSSASDAESAPEAKPAAAAPEARKPAVEAPAPKVAAVQAPDANRDGKKPGKVSII